MNKIEKAIIKTLCYFDIFFYPLTKEEIKRYLLEEKATDQEIENSIKNLLEERKIEFKENFYYLPGKEELIEERIKRYKISKKKWRKVKKYLWVFNLIPFIKFVGICNTLAFNNAKESSDIDLFIVIRKGRIWTSRALLTLVLSILRQRRIKKRIKDKFCLSFYVTEDNLNLEKIAIPFDIYLIYWTAQIVPILDRRLFPKFIKENEWIKRYLPNFSFSINKKFKDRLIIINLLRKIGELILKGKFGDFIEKKLGEIQKKKIKKGITDLTLKTAIIANERMLKFHPSDMREVYKKEFLKRTKLFLT